MKKALNFNWFDYFQIVGVIVVSAISALLSHSWDTLGFIVAVFGIVNLVLCAKGNIINYIFGIVYNAIYVYIAFSNSLYADAATYAFYYLPMQFVGWFNWKKKLNEESGTVKVFRLNLKQALIVLTIFAVTIPLLGYILSLPMIADAQPYADAATTIVSFVAMFLMVKAFYEQWYIWVMLDVLQCIKWVIATVNGQEHAYMMLIMFAFYAANAVYGLFEWKKLSKA